MAFLFDTDAISETLRSRPDPSYLAWLGAVPRDDLFASGITVGELFYGAYRAAGHGLELVTGNIRHYGRIPDLRIRPLRQAR